MKPTQMPMLVPLVDGSRLITIDWQMFLNEKVMVPLAQAPLVISSGTLSNLTASFPPTAFRDQSLLAGLYRVNYAIQVTTPASVSSSLTVVVSSTSNGVTTAVTGAAVTGNTTSDFQTASVVLPVDAGTDVAARVDYVSVGSPMAYSFSINLERL